MTAGAQSTNLVTPSSPRALAARELRCDLSWALSLFFTGLGAKLWLIKRCGTPLPYYDQWPAEAYRLFVPWFGHHLTPARLLEAHNEHRILFTRLLALALLVLNGQWDNQLEAAVNAVIHAASLAAFGWLMARLMGRAFWPAIWLSLALVLVLPFAWENTLWGFQSQFYFLLIASGLSLWLMGGAEAFAARWWCGVAAMVAGLFTMASGALTAAAVAAVALVDTVRKPDQWRRHLPTWAVCAVVVAAGFLLTPDVPEHHVLHARSPVAFLTALGLSLAWPWIIVPQFAVLNLAPLLLLGWIYARSGDRGLPAERLLLGVGIWVVLQAAAGAYARGAQGIAPYWRYMDCCSLILVANTLTVVLLLARHRPDLPFARLCQAGFLLWAIASAGGLWFITDAVWQIPLREREYLNRVQLRTTRDFVITGDRRALLNTPPGKLVWPDPVPIAIQLSDPRSRSILPACAREPLQIVPDPANSPAFVPNGWCLNRPDPPAESSWGSFSSNGASAHGTFESLPIRRSSLPYIEIPVAGDLGKPGLELDVIDLAAGQATPVKPPEIPPGRWGTAYVRAPPGEFKIVACDDSALGWFAFKEPREMGRLSYWTTLAVAGWSWFEAFGLVLLLSALLNSLRLSKALRPPAK